MKPTTEQIIELARDAGIEWQRNTTITGKIRISTCGSQPVDKLERFATLYYRMKKHGTPFKEISHA